MRTRLQRYALSAAVALVMLLVGKVADAQNLRVIPVPWVATDPTIPHYAYNGHPTTLKAIARGGNGIYSVSWDPEGDGTFMAAFSPPNRYNLQQVFTYPNVAVTTTYQARIRVTSNGQTIEADYPVRIFPSAPIVPCVVVPSAGCPAGTPTTTDEDLQIMRNVAIDDGLWYLHKQMNRSGNEEDLAIGARASGNVNAGYAIPASAGFLWSLGLNGHYAAYNSSYVGTLPDAAANTQRFEQDPFAEDAARLINYLLLNSQIITIPVEDESNLVGFPEVAQAPIAGTDDTRAIVWSGNDTYFMGHVLSALSKANLAGYVAQVGTGDTAGRRMEYVLQQAIDGLVYSQIDSNLGNNEGSWHYNSSPGNDDLSTTLWAVTGLWHADEFGGDELIVNNRLKSRLGLYITVNSRPNPANAAQRCGSYETEIAGCGHVITAAHLLSLGWLSGNTYALGDATQAFPGYNAVTRGTLRSYYDGTLAFIGGNFNARVNGSLNWNIGITTDGNFARSDRAINHYGMLHWQDAARAVVPAVETFGAANWYRHFTDYLMRNQETDGRWDSTSNITNNYSDDYGNVHLTTVWGLLVLQPDAIPPLAIAEATPTSTTEGTSIFFDGSQSDPGSATFTGYTWDFGNGDTLDGETVNYAFPDNGVYTVTLTTGSVGGNTSDTVVVTISNLPPVPTAGSVGGVEGSPTNFFSSPNDPGTADTHTYAWDFGDGGTGVGQNPSHTFVDEGTYTINLTVTDDDGGVGSITPFTVTIGNVAPAPTAGPAGTSPENVAVSFTSSPNDPGTADTHTYAWTFGDGGTSTDRNPSHTYVDEGTYAVSVTVTDNDGGSGAASFSYIVTNTAPTILTIGPAGPANEGALVNFAATASDPGPTDVLTFTWTFGDGSPAVVGASPSHAYVDDGVYTVTLTVTDGDGGSDVESYSFTVGNVAPSVTSVAPAAALEGTTVAFSASATDPGTSDVLTYAWNFGDGVLGAGASPSHVYADNGTYPVSVTVSDGDGGVTTVNYNYVVGNANPVATAGPAGAAPEGPINFVSAPNDPGTADTHTFAWDFGDGNTSTSQNPVHTYADEGTYQVSVTVTDDDGGTSTVTFEVVVSNANPAPVAGPTGPQAEGAAIAFTVSPNDPAPADTFTYAWDFGDGATSTDPDPTHAYGDNGVYTVTVTVTDDDGGVGIDTYALTVTNVAPAPTAGPAGNAQEGQVVAFFAQPNDAGVLDTHTYAWTFGDGDTSTDQNPSHAFLAVGTYTVTVTVTDDDGGVGTATFQFVVVEAQLAITSEPPSHAYEDQPYGFDITYLSGPGDVVTCSLPVAPPGMTVTGCTVSWPAPQLGQDGPIIICVADDDGQTACEEGYVWVHIVDSDGDGLSDPWEQDNFGNLDHGATGDADGDGVANIDEYTGGTDPNVFDGPGQLVLQSPVCGDTVDQVDPELVAGLGSDPQGHALTYHFQIFSDAAMSQLVAEDDDVDNFVDESVVWPVPEDLEENTWYHWRARAADHWTAGPWSEACSFFVNTVNDAPTAPRINTPAIGAWVDDLTPDLLVDNATDPDDDDLDYTFEVYSDAAMTLLVASESPVGQGLGSSGWTVDVTLTEDATYYWRVRATDPAGLDGPWSQTGVFTVNTENSPPEEPVILAPLEASTVGVLRPALVIRNSDDPDFDVLVYDWELATDSTFADVIDSGVDEPQEGPITTWFSLAADLEEDTRYCWRVRADDGASTSSYATACFLVSAVNDPPSVPTLMNPGDDTVVATVAPNFSWAPSTDPEGQSVTYDIEVMDSNGDVIATALDVGGTVTQMAEDLADGEDYTWRARAVDSEGAASQFSEVNAFAVLLPVDVEDDNSEAHVSGGSCSTGGGGGTGLVLLGLGLLVGRRRRGRR